MEAENFPRQAAERHSVGEVVGELATSLKDIVRSEMDLVRAEFREAAPNLGKHTAQAAAFGALLALSVFPFLAFLVIGLGDLLDGRYWLSSLIVAVVCAVVGGLMATRAYKKIKEHDLKFPRTQRSFERITDTFSRKVRELKSTPAGGTV